MNCQIKTDGKFDRLPMYLSPGADPNPGPPLLPNEKGHILAGGLLHHLGGALHLGHDELGMHQRGATHQFILYEEVGSPRPSTHCIIGYLVDSDVERAAAASRRVAGEGDMGTLFSLLERPSLLDVPNHLQLLGLVLGDQLVVQTPWPAHVSAECVHGLSCKSLGAYWRPCSIVKDTQSSFIIVNWSTIVSDEKNTSPCERHTVPLIFVPGTGHLHVAPGQQ